MIYKESLLHLHKYNLIITIGNEPFYRDQILNKITSDNPTYELIKFDCNDSDSKNIISEIRFKDLFNTPRIFHLKNFLKLKNYTFFIEKNFTDKIILDSERAGKSKEYNQLKEKALFIECKKPPPWEEKDDFVGKALGYLQSQGYSITQSNAIYLYNQLGYNLYRTIRELQKLVLYKENPSEITKKDIETICLKDLHYNVFEIIDQIIDLKKEKALQLLEKTFRYESTPGILLISLWYDHFETLLFLKNTSEEETVKYGKMSPFLIKKKLLPQSKKITVKKIMSSLNYLARADYNLRKGSFDLKYVLEKFIFSY